MILKKGSTGPAVRTLARDLARLGYYSGPATSTFDNEVWKAVRAFQMQGIDAAGRPLVVDGQAGPVTIAAIASELNGSTPSAPAQAAGNAPPGGSARARAALRVAMAELARGAGESGGNNKGPDVKSYLNGIIDPPADWCAAFVSFCFKNSGHPMPYNYSLGARDVLKQLKDNGWGVKVNAEAPPVPGDVIVWWRNAPDAWQGHIGIVHGYADGIVTTIEGNKTPKVGKFTYTLGAIDRLLGFARVP
jgi:peptidoglycan hydrolase-like protein with peptidoglycan-binding domain